MRPRRVHRAVCLAAILALASACTTTKVLKPETTGAFDPASARVLLLPADVQVGSLLASGIVEPRADWSKTAHGHGATKPIVEKVIASARFE